MDISDDDDAIEESEHYFTLFASRYFMCSAKCYWSDSAPQSAGYNMCREHSLYLVNWCSQRGCMRIICHMRERCSVHAGYPQIIQLVVKRLIHTKLPRGVVMCIIDRLGTCLEALVANDMNIKDMVF